jgi:hypothetical protein
MTSKKDLFCHITRAGFQIARGKIYSKLEKIINAEIPRNAATATATAAPPAGKIATNGPSQLLGSSSSV